MKRSNDRRDWVSAHMSIAIRFAMGNRKHKTSAVIARAGKTEERQREEAGWAWTLRIISLLTEARVEGKRPNGTRVAQDGGSSEEAGDR